MSIPKLILPVVAGVMSGMILQVLGERGIHAMYPMPTSFGMSGRESSILFFSQVSSSFYFLMLLNIALVSTLAGVISTLVYSKPSSIPAFIVGLVISLGEVFTITKLDGNPVFLSVLSVLLHLPLSWLGYYVTKKYFLKYLNTESK